MKKKIIRKKTVRVKRFTPREQQNINDLACSLSLLMPATSRGSFCLEKILKKEKLGKYFDKKLPNKKSQFKKFITQVFGRYPRKFKKIINNTLADSINWRVKKGDPVLKGEIEKLNGFLLNLKIDLKKEISELNLPLERPKITPPPIFVKQIIEKIGINPLLMDKVIPLFNDGHLNEAVRKAGEIFETRIKAINPSVKSYGRDLVSKVFNTQSPLINISGYHKSLVLDPNDEKEGYMYLSMGAMHWCKNIMGHSDVDQLDPKDAITRIMLISHLLDVLDKSII